MSARSGTGRSASQAVKGGEGLELAELLVQIGRRRADDEAVDALGGVGLRTAALHIDRTPAGVLENLRVAALGKSGRVHQFDLSEPFGRGQPAAGEEPVASPAGAAGGGRARAANVDRQHLQRLWITGHVLERVEPPTQLVPVASPAQRARRTSIASSARRPRVA